MDHIEVEQMNELVKKNLILISELKEKNECLSEIANAYASHKEYCIELEKKADNLRAELAEKEKEVATLVNENLDYAMRNVALTAEAERLKNLAETYEEYAALLSKQEEGLIGLAMVHGYKAPPEMVNKGIELRTRIKELKQAEGEG